MNGPFPEVGSEKPFIFQAEFESDKRDMFRRTLKLPKKAQHIYTKKYECTMSSLTRLQK